MHEELPDYRHPPVDEIVAAVQFRPFPRFGLSEMFAFANAMPDWELLDTLDALAPIVEPPPGQVGAPGFGFTFGDGARRAVFTKEAARWRLQVQHDRIAVHEVRTAARPSFRNVQPALIEVSECLRKALKDRDSIVRPPRAELVELIYVNRLDASRGFSGFGALGEIMRGLDRPSAEPWLSEPEAMRVGWAFTLSRAAEFVGRLRVEVSPIGSEAIQLQLNSRRYVGQQDPLDVLAACHADIVRGFTDMTTNTAHEVWGRFR